MNSMMKLFLVGAVAFTATHVQAQTCPCVAGCPANVPTTCNLLTPCDVKAHLKNLIDHHGTFQCLGDCAGKFRARFAFSSHFVKHPEKFSDHGDYTVSFTSTTRVPESFKKCHFSYTVMKNDHMLGVVDVQAV